ncbi:hypothetical protein COL23_25615 [Priestia aryabhattai]|uniref:hypothetical protein n=1 Tax=Priestia aryabhattai TaxID=412384 RepID=UPI000BF7237E|nr:hypothetical protein [Priestia aryabhattai]PFW72131.1 hypothetical protein COL23_25615 [Priestia aryabhattai]
MLKNTVTYQLVDSPMLNQIFEEKWLKITQENGFAYVSKPFEELKASHVTRFLIKDHAGLFVGTLEFVKFNLGYSILNHYHDFTSHQEFMENKELTYELGKIGIDQEHRGRHLPKILELMSDFARAYEVKYYLGAMEGKLYRLLCKFGLSLEQLADEIINEKHSAVPMAFHMEKLQEDMKHNKFLQRLERKEKEMTHS